MTIRSYQLVDFEDNELVKSIIKVFLENYPHLKIRVFNENTGFEEFIEVPTLYSKLDQLYLEDSGLDEISLMDNAFEILGITFHENLFIINIADSLKKQLETKFNIKLLEYQSKLRASVLSNLKLENLVLDQGEVSRFVQNKKNNTCILYVTVPIYDLTSESRLKDGQLPLRIEFKGVTKVANFIDGKSGKITNFHFLRKHDEIILEFYFEDGASQKSNDSMTIICKSVTIKIETK